MESPGRIALPPGRTRLHSNPGNKKHRSHIINRIKQRFQHTQAIGMTAFEKKHALPSTPLILPKVPVVLFATKGKGMRSQGSGWYTLKKDISSSCNLEANVYDLFLQPHNSQFTERSR